MTFMQSAGVTFYTYIVVFQRFLFKIYSSVVTFFLLPPGVDGCNGRCFKTVMQLTSETC